jgi:multidrug efflux pump subunit AcrA (membrane-fusion protein)
MRRSVLVAALFGAGCSSSTQDIPTLVVEQSLFEVQIRAQGELKAATSTPVKVPGELWGRQTLAWLVEDGAVVKAGDVVARLDDTEIAIQETDSAREVRKADLQIEGQGSTHRQEQQELANSIHINDVELNVAGKFAQHDKLIFSRNQVIDAEINLEFLQTKGGLLDSKQTRQSKKHSTDRQLLSLQRQTHSLKMLQVQEQRGRMALVAPHDGLFVAGRNWDGEKFKVGSQLWRGQEIGSLPDVSKMEALVRVLESEMSGVTVGVPASLVLDAYPQRVFHGKVKSLAAVANPIERDSPVKYFDVTIEIDETDAAVLKPGLRVNSTLAAKRQEGVIAIPNQAIFRKGEEVWVLVKNGSGFDKRNVTLGERSPTRTVVASGLEPGDAIALGNAEAS